VSVRALRLPCPEREAGEAVLVGIVSDTHGHLDSQLLEEFEGASLIVHAGDIGADVLEALRDLAPVMAVEGNTDSFPPGFVEHQLHFEYCGFSFFVKHDVRPGERDVPDDVDVVISGHTHVPEAIRMGETLFLNPGSLSRSRRSDSVGTAMLLDLGSKPPSARLLHFP
jgi:putative phosphoesterase